MLITSKMEMRMWESDEKTLSIRVQFQFYVMLILHERKVCVHTYMQWIVGYYEKKMGIQFCQTVMEFSSLDLWKSCVLDLCIEFDLSQKQKKKQTKTNDNVSNNDIFGWEREVSKKKKNKLQLARKWLLKCHGISL